jgi:pyruvate,water dikinase
VPNKPPQKASLLDWLGIVLRALVSFLEIIGLRAPRPVISHQAQLVRFRRNYLAFRRLLSANDNFLRRMVDLDRKLIADDLSDAMYVRKTTGRMVSSIHQMIASLNDISGGRHAALWDVFRRIKLLLSQTAGVSLEERHPSLTPSTRTDTRLVIELSEVDQDSSASVGGKMANLGEVRNNVGLPTPDGFAVIVDAYRRLVHEHGLEPLVERAAAKVSNSHGVGRTALKLAEQLRQASVPAEVQQALLEGYDRLAARQGAPCLVAVRSSALGEDASLSFAGQYETVLNVARDGLIAAWSTVVGSLYSLTVVQYRRLQEVNDTPVAMAVGVVAMVPAILSGVVFSRDPARAGANQVVIQLVSGLGVHLVDGSSNPETIEVQLGHDRHEIRRSMVRRTGQRTLSDTEVFDLTTWSRRLEAHFGRPQDIEWSMDEQRRLFVLQARPLRLAEGSASAHDPLPGATILVQSGEIVCPGFVSGLAVHADEDGDLSTFPKGAILVAKRSSPRFVALMGKTAAIVTDAGSTTGHMASLAREFRIPTILGTGDGTRSIPSGTIITVDALRGFVYAGAIDLRASLRPKSAIPVSTESQRLMRTAAEHIVPLSLTDPRTPQFSIEHCRTLHDIARFVHEKSYEEMFRLGESLGDLRAAAYYLDVFLPVDMYIIDLGGGISGTSHGNRVTRRQIRSVPLAALVTGMLHPKIPRWGARPIDVGGFMSVVMRHAVTSPDQEQSFRDPCYALASDRYLNCTTRVGYHFSIVDAYCGETTNKNYVHLLFRGGAADMVRRSRRARAIAGILKEWGFAVETLDDSTQGRITKMPRDQTAHTIELVGRLLQFMRQMDVAMTSEDAVFAVQRAFLDEDYALETLTGKNDG